MIFVGVDPGKQGAVVAIDEAGTICFLAELPFLEDGSADFPTLLKVFLRLKGSTIFLERAVPMAMGAKHAFTYGRDFAAIEIAIQQTGIPVHYVEPAKWPKVICEGIDSNLKPKVRSVMAARRIFPEQIEKLPVTPKSKKIHEGFVDALLLAEFGRRLRLLN